MCLYKKTGQYHAKVMSNGIRISGFTALKYCVIFRFHKDRHENMREGSMFTLSMEREIYTQISSHFILLKKHLGKRCNYSQLRDEEIEAQRSEVTCPSLQNGTADAGTPALSLGACICGVSPQRDLRMGIRKATCR